MSDIVLPRDVFTLAVHNNPYRSPYDRQMHAVISVNAAGLGQRVVGEFPEAAEVIIMDNSGSMNLPPAKAQSAKNATISAIKAIRDAVSFAVVAGTGTATMVYPADEGLVVADDGSRRAAIRAVKGLRPSGGTAMGTWLNCADRLFRAHPRAMCHVLMFTDGKNEHEKPEVLDATLAGCSGEFICDVRGIGTQWDPTEVLRIASALDGTADVVGNYADLEGELREIMERAMRKQVTRVGLRVRPMTDVRLRFLKQTYPTRVDLTDRLVAIDGRGGLELDTGAWGDERREYHVCLDLEPARIEFGSESVAVRIELDISRADLGTVPAVPVMLQWTDDEQLSSRVDIDVDRVAGLAEMGRSIDTGHAALDRGDRAAAEEFFGRAVRLAHEFGDPETGRRMRTIVDVVDLAGGLVVLKTDIDEADLISTQIRIINGTNDVAAGPDSGAGARRESDQEPGPERGQAPAPEPVVVLPPDEREYTGLTCPSCGFAVYQDELSCEQCCQPLGAAQ